MLKNFETFAFDSNSRHARLELDINSLELGPNFVSSSSMISCSKQISSTKPQNNSFYTFEICPIRFRAVVGLIKPEPEARPGRTFFRPALVALIRFRSNNYP